MKYQHSHYYKFQQSITGAVGKARSWTPGDNPVYMTSADLTGGQQSPSHSTVVTTPPTESTEVTEPAGDSIFDDTIYGSSLPRSTDCTHGKLDPYGNYGDKTITRVAGLAPPPPLFDDNMYECTPELIADSDDVDSDYQSEYL